MDGWHVTPCRQLKVARFSKSRLLSAMLTMQTTNRTSEDAYVRVGPLPPTSVAMMITPPDEISSTPAVVKRRMGTTTGTPLTADRLKKPFHITLSDDKENAPTPTHRATPQASQRLYTPQSVDRLIKPFKCPGSATVTRTSDKPARKRRKVDYGGADGSHGRTRTAWLLPTGMQTNSQSSKSKTRRPCFESALLFR